MIIQTQLPPVCAYIGLPGRFEFSNVYVHTLKKKTEKSSGDSLRESLIVICLIRYLSHDKKPNAVFGTR